MPAQKQEVGCTGRLERVKGAARHAARTDAAPRRAPGVPGLHTLVASAAQAARALQLPLPDANAAALLRRFALELGVPQARRFAPIPA